MTLDELSAKSGVSKSILSQIERDLSNPTVATISRIAEALDEKLSDFFLKIEVEETSSIESSKQTPSITSEDGLCDLNILGAGDSELASVVYFGNETKRSIRLWVSWSQNF